MSAVRALASVLALCLVAGCGGEGEQPAEPTRAPAAAAAPLAAPSAEELLDWAGWAYPDLLAYPDPTQTVQLDSGPAQARRHVGPMGDRWLAVDSQGGVWGLGDFTDGALRRLGVATDWSAHVQADRCQVYPLATGCGMALPDRRLGIGVAEGLALLGPERRLVAWGRARGTGAVDMGQQARWLAGTESGPQVVTVDASGQLSGWDCLQQWEPSTGVFYCLSSSPASIASAGRVVQAELMEWNQSLVLREDGSLWLGLQSMQIGQWRLHGLPRMRQLARMRQGWRTDWTNPLQDVLAVGLDGRVWQINIVQLMPYARELTGLPAVRSASCTYGNCVVLATDGTVWVWGANNQGQLGNGLVQEEVQITPQPVAGLQDMVDVAVQHQALYAVGRDGRVWTWGGNDDPNPLPRRSHPPLPRPVLVDGITGAVEIATSRKVVLVRRTDGSVWGWGDNVDGLLDPRPGSDTYFANPVPVAVPGLDLR